MIIRNAIFLLAVLQALLSLLFYQSPGLYSFLEERAELVPVAELVNQGGYENNIISMGVILYFIIAIFFLLRFSTPISWLDIGILSAALIFQGLALTSVENGSFSHSINSKDGWILMSWFMYYGCLWLALLTMAFFRKRSLV